MSITGHTKLVGVMGWPVSHTLSPPMQNAALRHGGIDAAYVPLAVEPDRITDAVRGLRALGYVGSNVTIPHKQAVFALMDTLTAEAEVIGAVNTIRVEEDGSLTGHNTDCLGAVRAVETDGTLVRGRTVLVIGAGGAGRGVAAGAAFAGADRIVILNRTPEKAQAVAEELGQRITLDPSLEWYAGGLDEKPPIPWEDIDVVFQMTSVGMRATPGLPLDPGVFRPGCHVLEGIYAPLETEFFRKARAKGLQVTGGLEMLMEQGAASFAFWFGQEPNKDVMRQALRDAVRSREEEG